MITILAVCGMGLGSSLLARMTAERVLAARGLGSESFTIDVADLGTARRPDVDLYITTHEFTSEIGQWGARVVEVRNVFDEAEMARALLPAIDALTGSTT